MNKKIKLKWVLLVGHVLYSVVPFAQQPTYYNNIKSIIQKNCVSCHRPDGYAPFSLAEYDDVAKRSKFIRLVVKEKIMPPWKANNHYRDFANNKSLTDSAIEQLTLWIDNGCVKGDSSVNEQNKPTSNTQKINTKPDLILKMKEPFTVPAINQNVYICYKIPFELSCDTFVRSIEFIPGNKSVVHHASYQVLGVAEDVNLNASPDYFIFNADTLNRVKDDHDYRYFNLFSSTGQPPAELYHGGWLPGTTAQVYPKNIGFRLPKKGVLLIRNFHYSPSPIEQQDQSRFEIYFSKYPPKRTIGFAAFKPKNHTTDGRWYIKANDSNFHAHINVKFHNDVSLLNINPHMHRLGVYFKAYAVTKNGDTIPLVEIPRWDFNWQEFYRFKKMVKIPAGSILHADAIYDNSTRNVENPYHPPQDVLFELGMNDDSEMMRLVLLYLPYESGDEKISLE